MSENEKKSEKKSEKKTDDGLAATVRKQGETIQKLLKILETMFGIDINKDGKIGLLMLALGLSCLSVFAVSPSTNTVFNLTPVASTNDVFQVDKFGNVKADGTATITGNIISSGNVIADNISSNGTVLAASTTLSLTNGQIITLGDIPVIRVSAAGQAGATTTNTIANADSAYVGARYTIINVGDSNGVLVVDSAPVYNSGATLGTMDASVYQVITTTQIVQTATSNN